MDSIDHVASLGKLSLDDASSALASRASFIALFSRLSEVVNEKDRVDRILLILSLLAEEDATWLARGLTISFQEAGDGVTLMSVVTPTAPDGEGAPTFFLSLPVEEFGSTIMKNPDAIGGLKARFDAGDVFLDLPPRPEKDGGPPPPHTTRRMTSVVVPPMARPTPVPPRGNGGKGGAS